jgi:hypothetical protein
MAVKKKKAAKRSAKTSKAAARKPAGRKTAKKAAPPKKAKAKKKSWVAKAVSEMTGLIRGKKAKKKATTREFGEGNYKASKRFRTQQEAFVKTNRKKIPALGKAAEAALEGPEGDELRAAESAAAAGNTGGTY